MIARRVWNVLGGVAYKFCRKFHGCNFNSVMVLVIELLCGHSWVIRTHAPLNNSNKLLLNRDGLGQIISFGLSLVPYLEE